jgi:hypothetical protein
MVAAFAGISLRTRPRALAHACQQSDTRGSNAIAPFPSAPGDPREQPSAAISSRPSPCIRHWHFPSKISFSPYTFPLCRIRLRADSTSQAGRLSLRSSRPYKELRHGPFQPLASSHPLPFEALGVTAMTLPSFSSIELEALMVIGSLLILAATIVVILFSAIVGTGLARLLYLGGRSCVKTILPNLVPFYQPVAVGHKGVKN